VLSYVVLFTVGRTHGLVAFVPMGL